MYKKSFIVAFLTGIISALFCLIYSRMYFSILVDFSEVESVKVVSIFSKCISASILLSFLHFGLRKMIKKKSLSNFIFNFLFAIVSIFGVFYLLKTDDPTLTGDAELFVDYFKGFIMPMIFFPFLIWMTIQPLVINE